MTITHPQKGVMISAPRSGAGKTTVMLGLLRALHDKGLTVQPFKSGPDYIDPAFHQAACFRPSFNLDSWAMPDAMLSELRQQGEDADIILAEGSMGLFDGVAHAGESGCGASAEISRYFGWPVILVIDVSGQAQSAAATALGFQRYWPELPFAGVILNRVSSDRHDRLIREGMAKLGITVFGSLPKRGDLALAERHLGLIQATEHPDLDAAISSYAEFLSTHIALDDIIASAHSFAPSPPSQWTPPSPPAQRIALAQDEAFSFTYPHLLHYWRHAGAEILPFSPLNDECPDKDADLIWLAGGYPELHAGRLAASTSCFQAIRKHAKTKPVHGECGGYMALGDILVDASGTAHKMLGLLGLVTSFEKRKFHLGYRLATALEPCAALPNAKCLRGHEFHYTTILEQPDSPLFDVVDANHNPVAETGSYRNMVSGTFFHLISEAT